MSTSDPRHPTAGTQAATAREVALTAGPVLEAVEARGLRVDAARYHLTPRARFGAAPHDPREGAVLRVRFDDGATGYADLHPWSELGDLPLERALLQVGAAISGEQSALGIVAGSLRLARLDAVARAEGRSLFATRPIPESHALWTDVRAHAERRRELIAEGERLARSGIRVLKLKLGRDPEHETPNVRALVAQVPSMRLRLDFNGRGDDEAFLSQWDALGSEVHARVDFVEDPTARDDAEWPDRWRRLAKATGARLALDRGAGEWIAWPRERWEGALSVLVIKPAVDDVDAIVARLADHAETSPSAVITSYLGHPIEQLASAWVATELRARGVAREACGVLGHETWGPSTFVDALSRSGAHLVAPAGTGVGFDALVETLDFVSLNERD